MAGGGSSKEQTTTAKSEPWIAAQPALREAVAQTHDAFKNAGQGYNGSTVAGLSGETTGLIGQAVKAGYSPNAGMAASLFNSAAANGISQDANNFYSSLIGGNLGAADAARSAMGAVGGANPALAQALAGASAGATNPYLDATFDQAAAKVRKNYEQNTAPTLESAFSSAGRLGSGAFALASANSRNTADETVNRLATDIYGGAYEADANRRLSYAGLAGNLANADKANTLQATGLLQSGLNTDLAAKLSGASGSQGIASSMFGQNLAAGNALLGLDSSTLNNSLAALKASGVLDQQAQNELDSEIQQINNGQNPNLQKLQTYLPLLQGLGGLGSSTSQSAPVFGASKTAKALGGAASGAALGSQIYPGYGTAIGAVAGGLYGYFG